MRDKFTKDILQLDPEREVSRIAARLRHLLSRELKRRGLVVGLSGGIDSSATAALAVRAFGKKQVFGLLMPERHSSPDTLELSRSVADPLDINIYIILDPQPKCVTGLSGFLSNL